ncbi:hypothetical protein [Paeniglutamicibacter terrestris]|uniref:Uncharacterized protein n=1 Tax=Paeniglutamicibacter terrestris TaxID=2723403 RepID=A0ABX1G4A7_9MICC|nr:hypothetical protein [Paeniglutamicibacter terrestris]NKG21073.1 hypothetical protein [Paeniglutamicibacter terrestris]
MINIADIWLDPSQIESLTDAPHPTSTVLRDVTIRTRSGAVYRFDLKPATIDRTLAAIDKAST